VKDELKEKSIDKGFPPILGADPKVLILGSMPGVKSLEEQQYYGHPRNAFWWILSNVCGFSFDLEYEQRLEEVKHSRIAIWDVAHSCHRPGSLDSNIDQSSLKANDINALLEGLPSIKLLVFNGQAAAKLFKKFIGEPSFGGRVECLPSTSPANAGMKREEKLEKWRVLEEYLEPTARQSSEK
jgi:hypoxanthine-DNA glycosylase